MSEDARDAHRVAKVALDLADEKADRAVHDAKTARRLVDSSIDKCYQSTVRIDGLTKLVQRYCSGEPIPKEELSLGKAKEVLAGEQSMLSKLKSERDERKRAYLKVLGDKALAYLEYNVAYSKYIGARVRLDIEKRERDIKEGGEQPKKRARTTE